MENKIFTIFCTLWMVGHLCSTVEQPWLKEHLAFGGEPDSKQTKY